MLTGTAIAPLTRAFELGQAGMDRAAKHAGEDFTRRAKDCVLTLLEHGPMAGEELVDACKQLGHLPPDDRAFGAVFASLSKAGKIVKTGITVRTKGHGSPGGRVWALKG